MHHVHQCHACGLRFDLFVRCRGAIAVPPTKFEGVFVRAGNRVGLRMDGGHIVFFDDAIDAGLENRRVVVTVVVVP